MCQGNYFNIRIWGKNISGGTEERPIEHGRSYILLFCLLARWSAYLDLSFTYLLTSHGPKASLMHLILGSPWTRQAHFELEVFLIFYYESPVGVDDIGLIVSC